jgi:hypothetical protein
MRTCVYVSASTFAERFPTSSAISAHVLPCAWSSEMRRCLRSCGDQSGVPGSPRLGLPFEGLLLVGY